MKSCQHGKAGFSTFVRHRKSKAINFVCVVCAANRWCMIGSMMHYCATRKVNRIEVITAVMGLQKTSILVKHYLYTIRIIIIITLLLMK